MGHVEGVFRHSQQALRALTSSWYTHDSPSPCLLGLPFVSGPSDGPLPDPVLPFPTLHSVLSTGADSHRLVFYAATRL